MKEEIDGIDRSRVQNSALLLMLVRHITGNGKLSFGNSSRDGICGNCMARTFFGLSVFSVSLITRSHQFRFGPPPLYTLSCVFHMSYVLCSVYMSYRFWRLPPSFMSPPFPPLALSPVSLPIYEQDAHASRYTLDELSFLFSSDTDVFASLLKSALYSSTLRFIKCAWNLFITLISTR